MKVLTINPGSTSTKVALFENDECLLSKNVSHSATELAQFASIPDQLPYRKSMVEDALAEGNVAVDDLDAVVGRGGGLLSMEGGTYLIDEKLLDDAARGANGVRHPAQLGPLLANEFAQAAKIPAYVVNPPDVDELQDVARMTGIDGVYRNVHLHALNLKETAIRHAASQGVRYEDCNYIVCHIGGGVSVSAHRLGRMVDGYDIVGGEGPMAPTRCGSVSEVDLLDYLKDHTTGEARALCTKEGGFASLLGTSDAREVCAMADAGNKKAQLVWDTFAYQICKGIGAMASVLDGKVDGILLGGGIVHSEDLVHKIEETCGWIAPVFAYPGEFEMEAMASGACRVLRGEELPKHYTGRPAWSGFNF